MAERRYVIGNQWTTHTDDNGARVVKVTAWRDGAEYAVGTTTPTDATGTLPNGKTSDLITIPASNKLYLRINSLVGKATDTVQVEDADALKAYVDGAAAGGVTVAKLPAASTALAGATAFVTDANATDIGTTVAGGGSNKLLVVCDGAHWVIAGGTTPAA